MIWKHQHRVAPSSPAILPGGEVLNTNAKATVRVFDQDNNPVSGAEVHSHWDGLTTDSDIFTTRRNGKGSCKSDKVRNTGGWWYFYVDNAVSDGYVFRDDLGVTSGSIYAP